MNGATSLEARHRTIKVSAASVDNFTIARPVTQFAQFLRVLDMKGLLVMHFCSMSNYSKVCSIAAKFCIAAACLLLSIACASKEPTAAQHTPPRVDIDSSPTSFTPTPPSSALLPATTSLSVPANENIVLDDTVSMGTFEFAGSQHRILPPKTILSRPGGVENKDLNGFGVFVHPIPIIDTDSFVLHEREGQLPELSFTMHLIDDDVRNAAIKSLLDRGYRGISRDRIQVVPFGVLHLFAHSDAAFGAPWHELGMYPESLDNRAIRAATPTSINLRLRGDRDSLDSFKASPAIEAYFIIGGFTVTQNMLHLGIKNLVQQGYIHHLTGEGENKFIDQQRGSGGAGAVNLFGLASFGASKTAVENLSSKRSEVSRAQVMRMIRSFVTNGGASQWRERTANASDEDFIRRFTDFFIDQASATREVVYQVVEHDGKFFLDVEGVNRDRHPDVYTAVGAQASSNMALGPASSSTTVTSPDGKTAATSNTTPTVGFQASAAPANAGTIIIPKTSVQLFQFNTASFENMINFSVVDTVAETGQRKFSSRSVRLVREPVADPRPVTTRRFNESLTVGGGEANINFARQIMGTGNDEELDGKNGKLIDYELLIWLERVNERRYDIHGTFLAHEHGFAARQTKVGFYRGVVGSITVPDGHRITRIPVGERTLMSGVQERHAGNSAGTVRPNIAAGPGAIHVAVTQVHHGDRGRNGWHGPFTADRTGVLESGRYVVSFPQNHIVKSLRFVGDGNGGDRRRVRAAVEMDIQYEVTGPQPPARIRNTYKQ